MWILRRKGGLTAKKLAELCECRTSKKYIPRRSHFIINYGKDYANAHLNAKVIFNKLRTYNILKEAGIPQPRIWHKDEEIPEQAFPLLARKEYHSQGRDIIYVHSKGHLENEIDYFMYDFLVEYIKKTSEYRVHVLGNKAIVNVKFNEDGYGDPIVRSHSNGWRQISYDREWHDALAELAIKTIRALGYDFGAVDIIRKGDKLYVLEVNSAPGLEDRKLKEYSDYFKEEEEKWLNSI
jgi:glutathione synthase/RimK-type ligase-like ATP-grasp enzyme